MITRIQNGCKAVHFQRCVGSDGNGQQIGQFKECFIVFDDNIGILQNVISANRSLGFIADLHGNAVEAFQHSCRDFALRQNVMDIELSAKGAGLRQCRHSDIQHVSRIRIYGVLDLHRIHRTGELVVAVAERIDQQIGRGCHLQRDLAVNDLSFQLPEQIALGLVHHDTHSGIILQIFGQVDLHSSLIPLLEIDNNSLAFHGGLQHKLLRCIIHVVKGIAFIQSDREAIAEGITDPCRAVE